ncbi:putrescine transporter subunit: membrane component of ABC superfamily [Kluyvera cryocrescens]|uniref:Putrescine transporter subunit: membrane component of ABC superfamily n=1 Tax=Kluyvera cryocrescens TaxID=580 RepID=A0A485ADW7_KLUCR|nr:putrescine transporter subunit: membrane component of ABC superfamily [Kluyvera cryocrescens]
MNNLPVVRSPWRILILVIGFTFLYAPNADVGYLFI